MRGEHKTRPDSQGSSRAFSVWSQEREDASVLVENHMRKFKKLLAWTQDTGSREEARQCAPLTEGL
jgi:hypothetical protein